MEKALSPEEIGVYRRRLLEEFSSSAREVEAIEREALEPSGGSRFQDVDESIEETELDTELGALAVEDRIGYEVHEALERISEGTFGKCESCGRPIARQRLNLLPYARRCSACERRAPS